MSLGRRLLIATIFAIAAAPCCAWAGGGWHNTLPRKLGLGWSDGYHANEGCPTERVGSRKHPSRQGHGHSSFFGPYSSSWMPERPHHGLHGRGIVDGDFYGESYDDRFDDPTRPSPTPALRPSPISPDAPEKPPILAPSNDKEARKPSEMFRLAPIR